MPQTVKVLIVEDEPIIRVFLKSIVSSEGHHVVASVSNGKDALEQIQSQVLDLIFMDINILGPIDGIQVVKQMKALSDPLVYFISAYNDVDTIDEALSTSAHNYLTKPLKEEDIYIALTMAKKHHQIVDQGKIILSESLTYEKESAELFSKNTLVKLSKIEKYLLDLFVKNLNKNVSIESLKNSVWGEKEVQDSTIRSALHGLRKKVPSLHIENNVGRGYILVSE